jgi:hypothetical protein
MNRYFKIDCDKEGKADEATLVEIYAPETFYTTIFSVGVLVGVIVAILFR